jgi:uncharacterized RDD family membrane protein YckC
MPPMPPESAVGQFPPPGSFATPASAPYATWGTRLGGYVIDIVIFAIVQIVLDAALRPSHVLIVHMTMTNKGTVHHNTFSILAVILTAVLAIVYSTVLCGSPRGQTVGMMAVGVRAVRVDTGEALGYTKAFGRSLLEQILRPTVVGWLLDGFFPLWDPRRQTLHDKASGTVVIRVRSAG